MRTCIRCGAEMMENCGIWSKSFKPLEEDKS